MWWINLGWWKRWKHNEDGARLSGAESHDVDKSGELRRACSTRTSDTSFLHLLAKLRVAFFSTGRRRWGRSKAAAAALGLRQHMELEVATIWDEAEVCGGGCFNRPRGGLLGVWAKLERAAQRGSDSSPMRWRRREGDNRQAHLSATAAEGDARSWATRVLLWIGLENRHEPKEMKRREIKRKALAIFQKGSNKRIQTKIWIQTTKINTPTCMQLTTNHLFKQYFVYYNFYTENKC
jgi:hypothetical protein